MSSNEVPTCFYHGAGEEVKIAHEAKDMCQGRAENMKQKLKIRIKWLRVAPWERSEADSVPEKDGVYELVVKQASDGNYERRYVGQAADLRERFLRHLAPSEQNECIKAYLAKYACAFDYALVGTRDDRLDAERALYFKHRSAYRCNVEVPPGSGRGYDVEVIEE